MKYEFDHRHRDLTPADDHSFPAWSTERNARIICFDLAVHFCTPWVTEFLSEHGQMRFHAQMHGLLEDKRFLPDRRAQGFQLSFGSRPVAWISKGRLEAEEGATLLITRGSDGFCSVLLYPCRSDQRTFRESHIIWCPRIEPRKLTSKSKFKSLLAILLAYQEVTSYDGRATWLQRLRIACIRATSPQNVDGQVVGRPAIRWAKWVGNWIAVVGLSGALLHFITR